MIFPESSLLIKLSLVLAFKYLSDAFKSLPPTSVAVLTAKSLPRALATFSAFPFVLSTSSPRPFTFFLALSALSPTPPKLSFAFFPLFPALSKLVCILSAATLAFSIDCPALSADFDILSTPETNPFSASSKTALNLGIYFFTPFAARFSDSTRSSQLAAMKAFSR